MNVSLARRVIHPLSPRSRVARRLGPDRPRGEPPQSRVTLRCVTIGPTRSGAVCRDRPPSRLTTRDGPAMTAGDVPVAPDEIVLSVKKNELGPVEEWLAAGNSADSFDSRGDPLLVIATYFGATCSSDCAMTELLLSAGASWPGRRSISKPETTAPLSWQRCCVLQVRELGQNWRVCSSSTARM